MGGRSSHQTEGKDDDGVKPDEGRDKGVSKGGTTKQKDHETTKGDSGGEKMLKSKQRGRNKQCDKCLKMNCIGKGEKECVAKRQRCMGKHCFRKGLLGPDLSSAWLWSALGLVILFIAVALLVYVYVIHKTQKRSDSITKAAGRGKSHTKSVGSSKSAFKSQHGRSKKGPIKSRIKSRKGSSSSKSHRGNKSRVSQGASSSRK